ncbi:MAG: hypothetical protein ACSHX4_04200 [Opitutaceae bacterium]
MKNILTIAVLLFMMGLTSCVMLPKKSEVGFTSWMDGHEYQELFDRRSRSLYPVVVEAKLSDRNEILYRAYYAEIPGGRFWFWSNHGISTAAFEENKMKHKKNGFVLIHHQTLHVKGRTVHQATWAKQK